MMKLASSLARNRAAQAMSSPSPERGVGVARARLRSSFCSLRAFTCGSRSRAAAEQHAAHQELHAVLELRRGDRVDAARDRGARVAEQAVDPAEPVHRGIEQRRDVVFAGYVGPLERGVLPELGRQFPALVGGSS